MIPRLVIASKNRDKLVEIERVLGESDLCDEIVRDLEWDDVEETEPTIEGNALLKARTVAEATGLPTLGDDTGLEVESMGGRPGVRSARYAGESASYAENRAKLLDELDGASNRAARFRTVVALVFPDGVEVTAEGTIDGTITTTERGSEGFGYDPVFEVDGRTFGEMTIGEKSELSHRARALRALFEKLGV